MMEAAPTNRRSQAFREWFNSLTPEQKAAWLARGKPKAVMAFQRDMSRYGYQPMLRGIAVGTDLIASKDEALRRAGEFRDKMRSRATAEPTT